jgi:guanylate kinase
MQGKIIIVSAPSGAGKSTIVKKILDQGLDIEFSVSACSRPIRDGEVDGVHYYFLSTEEFKDRIINGEFIEWEEVYEDHFYGTLKAELDRVWNNGNAILIDADAYGGINIKKQFGDQALSIFIMPPDKKTLRDRLISRSTDKPESIELRMAKAGEELALAYKFDKVVINDKLETAVREVLETIEKFLEDG